MDAVETDLLCGGLSLTDVGDGFSSFLNWTDDVLDHAGDNDRAFCPSGGFKRCFLRLDIGPADMLQADALPVLMDQETSSFTEGDVLVASTEAGPGAQWRPALPTSVLNELSAGCPEVPDIIAMATRRRNMEMAEAPSSSDSGGNCLDMTHDSGRRSARRRTPTSAWPEELSVPPKRQRRKEDDGEYNVSTLRRIQAPGSPGVVSPLESVEDKPQDGYRRKFGLLVKTAVQPRTDLKRSAVNSPAANPEQAQDDAGISEDEEEDWRPPSDRSGAERPRPVQRKPPVEAQEGAPVVRAGGVFKTAALNVLRTERRLLSTGEITRVALRLGFLGSLPGKTPEATMASALYTDIKKGKGRNGAGSIFCRPAEGSFGLREWYADPELAHILDPSSRGPTPRSQRGSQAGGRRGAAVDSANNASSTVHPSIHIVSSGSVNNANKASSDGRLGGQGRVACSVMNDYSSKKQGSSAAAAC